MPEIEEVLPKYLQIAGYLRDRIVRGDLPPGAEVPSERELSADWRVARPTASKALQVLRQQGLVESRRGSGTYVRNRPAAPRARERYSRVAEFGTMYSDNESVEFLHAGVVAAPAYVSDALGIPAGSDVIERRRLIRGAVVGSVELSTSWFPASLAVRAPRLLELERVRGGTASYVAEVLGTTCSYARDQVCARLSTAYERRVLDLGRPSAVLVYQLAVFDSGDAVLQLDEAVYPQQIWSFSREYPVE
ncbi:GntR family transcriptional regulator [Nocardia sp. BMG51109]|uniref:GntR family transcriptional regulator n=1 Tax=Nocardia sp. BMG51109 TaxID=1056816 RepID=UPI000463D055|nr:GntR family transcriptional regulator [Nocardia sp. BMG51109]